MRDVEFEEWWEEATREVRLTIDRDKHAAWLAFIKEIGLKTGDKVRDVPQEKREVFRTTFLLIYG